MGYMIEGGGSKTLSKAKKWLYAYPELSHKLIDLLTEVIIDYLVMQVESGAQILQIFDSNADLLNKEIYTKFCLPYLKKIRDSVLLKLQQKKLEQVPMVKILLHFHTKNYTKFLGFICERCPLLSSRTS